MSMSDWSIFAALRCAIFVSSESTVKWECSERWRPKWHCFSLSGTCKRHTGTLLHTFSSEKTVTIVTHLDRPQRRHQVWAAGECPIGHFGVPLLFLPRCLISGRPLTLITGSFSLLAASPRASFGPSKRSFESPLVRVPKYPITYIYIIDGGCIYVSAGSEEAVVVEGAVEWDGNASVCLAASGTTLLSVHATSAAVSPDAFDHCWLRWECQPDRHTAAHYPLQWRQRGIFSIQRWPIPLLTHILH